MAKASHNGRAKETRRIAGLLNPLSLQNRGRLPLNLEHLESRIMLSTTTTALAVADAFPLVNNGQWLYAIKENGQSEVGVTNMFSTGANSFRMVESVSTHASTAFFTSTPSGIFATSLQANGIGTITFATPLEFAPSVLTVGETYSATSATNSTFTIGGFSGSFTGTTKSSGKVIGWVHVVTAAGTFEALHAIDTMTFSGSGTIAGFPGHGSMTLSYDMDLVPGIGIVAGTRQISISGSAAGHSDSSTIRYTSSLTSTNNLPAPTGVDLTVQYSTDTLPNPAVPGDKGNVTVIVTNQGETPANGSMELDLYASPDQDPADGVLVTGGTLTGQAVTLNDGQSQLYTFKNVRLPALASGQYNLVAVVNPTKSIVESNYANDTAAAPQEIDFAFGAVGTRKKVVLNLTEADGTNVSFAMSGPGTGTITEGINGWDLDVIGTTSASGVTITTKKGLATSSGLQALNDITVAGPLKTFSGAGVNLTGAMTVSGSLGKLTLNNLSGDGGITLGGASTDKTTLTFNQVDDESLTTGSTITSLTAASWEDSDADGDTITAPALTKLTIKNGDLAADLNIGAGGIGTLSVTGGNLVGDIVAASAGAVSVTGGSLSGSLTIAGNLKSLGLSKSGGASPVGGNIAAGAAVKAGTIGSLKVAGSLQGATGNVVGINAGTITSLSVAGDMDYTALNLTNTSSAPTVFSLGTMTVGGNMFNSQLLSAGNIKSVTVGGMENSEAFAGVASFVTFLPNAKADFAAQDSIGKFTIKGGSTTTNSLSNSTIAAWTLGTMNLGYPDNSINGVACNTYGALSYHAGTVMKTWKKSDPTAMLPGGGVVRLIPS